MHSTAFLLLLHEPPWLKKSSEVPRQTKKGGKIELDGKHNVAEDPNLHGEPSSTMVAADEKEEISVDITGLFKMPMFYALFFYCAWADYSSSVLSTTVVDYMMDKGSSQREAENIIVYMSSTELVGRLLIPLLADRGLLRRSTLVMACFVLLSLLTFVLPEVTLYSLSVTVCVSVMLLFGCVTTMKGVLMADYLGIGHVSACFGFAGLATIPVTLVNPSIVGKLPGSFK